MRLSCFIILSMCLSTFVFCLPFRSSQEGFLSSFFHSEHIICYCESLAPNKIQQKKNLFFYISNDPYTHNIHLHFLFFGNSCCSCSSFLSLPEAVEIIFKKKSFMKYYYARKNHTYTHNQYVLLCLKKSIKVKVKDI